MSPQEINWGLEIIKIAPILIIGMIAAHIAYRQWLTAAEQKRIAAARLNLDLFEKRMEVFNATWGAASRAILESPAPQPTAMTNLLPNARFLFKPEVEAYMDELSKKIIRLGILAQMHDPSEHAKERYDLSMWMYDAAAHGVRDKFAPYLDFSEWR